MKIILISLCAMMCSTFCQAQNTASKHWFFRIGAGTQTNVGDAFRGASISTEIGKRFGGWEISGNLTYYHGTPNQSVGFGYNSSNPKFTTEGFVEQNLHNQQTKNGITLTANLGYDLVHLFDEASRHHLTPIIGVGYGRKNEINSEARNDGMISKSVFYNTFGGFEFRFGGRYEYAITPTWAIGLFYENNTLQLENGITGISIKKEI